MNDPESIRRVHAWEALDSRGRPTVGCTVELNGGTSGRAIVPSGASRGSHEAHELRDGGGRYRGFGVRSAVDAVNNEIGPAIVGRSAADRVAIDSELEAIDGQPQFSRLGANAALAVSLGATIAHANATNSPLWTTLDPSHVPLIPMPMVNILSGGAHAGRAVDLQDFLAIPIGASSFAEAMEWIDRVRHACAELLDQAGGWSALVADEGGLSARLGGNERALELLARGIERSGLAAGDEVAIGLDVAASQLTRSGQILLAEEGRSLTPSEWVDVLIDWVSRFPIVSIEDALGEDDWSAWTAATSALGDIQLLGDDLFVTDEVRLTRGIQEKAANAVLVKVNQTGTVSRAERVVRAAQDAGYRTVVSARSGDTEDNWLADLAVGWRAGQIKVGSTMRSERTAKWNRLLEIESEGETQFARFA